MQYENEEVSVEFSKYENNGRLALILKQDYEIYAVLTVNLEEDIQNEYCAYIDTNNCGDYALEWLERNNFGKWTGRWGFSGFCTYPEFEFNKDVVEKFSKEKSVC